MAQKVLFRVRPCSLGSKLEAVARGSPGHGAACVETSAVEMDGGDAFDTLVPIRPYQKGSGADDRRTKARSFRPQMPSKNIKVEHVQFAAGAASSSAEAMLKDAYRKQERQDVKREGFVPTRNQGVSLPSDFKG
eukprot:5000061-Amphidinium_carterae.1